jgi:hypothetical protein
MKRFGKAVLTLACCAAFSGCASVLVEGPAGDPIKLAPTGRVTTKTQSFKTWYMFWGLMPLGDTSTSQMIQETGFKTVRVEVKIGVDDWIMNILGIVPVIPCSRTVEITGE